LKKRNKKKKEGNGKEGEEREERNRERIEEYSIVVFEAKTEKLSRKRQVFVAIV